MQLIEMLLDTNKIDLDKKDAFGKTFYDHMKELYNDE